MHALSPLVEKMSTIQYVCLQPVFLFFEDGVAATIAGLLQPNHVPDSQGLIRPKHLAQGLRVVDGVKEVQDGADLGWLTVRVDGGDLYNPFPSFTFRTFLIRTPH